MAGIEVRNANIGVSHLGPHRWKILVQIGWLNRLSGLDFPIGRFADN